MGLTAKMILPPEKPLQDDTSNCVKSCLMKRYLCKAVKLDYIIIGNQGISTASPNTRHTPGDKHLRGWKAQKTNNDLSSFLNIAFLLSPLQIFINNQHEVKTDPIYCLNKLCLMVQKKSVYNLSSKCICLRLCNNFSFVDNTLHFPALAVLMSTSILNG